MVYISGQAQPSTNRRTSGIKLTNKAPRPFHDTTTPKLTQRRSGTHIPNSFLQLWNVASDPATAHSPRTHINTQPHTRTSQPQPCSASLLCNRGNSPAKFSTLRSSFPPPSCSGKEFPLSPTRHHPLSSSCQGPWSPRSKEEICCSYGTGARIRK